MALSSEFIDKEDTAMKRKHFLVIVLAIVIIAGIVTGFFLFNDGRDEMQDLVLLEQGIKITAPEKDVERYIEARKSGADSDTLEMILNDILSNPECVVKELPK